MTYRGRVQGGVIVLEDPLILPEGTQVQIEPLVASNSTTPKDSNWADVLKDVIGTAEGLPADSSRNHDHYLYGSEKK